MGATPVLLVSAPILPLNNLRPQLNSSWSPDSKLPSECMISWYSRLWATPRHEGLTRNACQA